jgi:ribokinase|tara:strand:+ start:5784 stop:6659 length:876 start_codon:yes stop_codon:yes gene_type:complete
MTIYNLGSINIDMVYQVPHLPVPGETLAAKIYSQGLGGKGANMSVAAARAAARVRHIGAVGADGRWAVERLLEYGVDTTHISEFSGVTGHAVINVDDAGENAIVLWAGANNLISTDQIGRALAEANTGDTLIMQNETSGQLDAAKMAKDLGLKVVYAAAPFDANAITLLLPYIDLLVLNEVEAQQLKMAIGKPPEALEIDNVIVTLGGDGCRWYANSAKLVTDFSAIKVDPIDTTGAGDTFTGYVVAGLDRGMVMERAIHLASQAGALMVTRLGTADVIPDLKEIQDAKLA